MKHRVEVKLPYSLYVKAEEECRRSGLSLTQLIAKALEFYLEGTVETKDERAEGLDILLGEVRRLSGEVRELRALIRDLAEELSEVKLYLSAAKPVAKPHTTLTAPLEELPSYFRDNPWLDILRRRGEWPGP